MDVIFFLTVMFLVTLVLFVITRLATERLVHHHYAQKSDFFRSYPLQCGDIVFLGDSITDGACWEEVFPNWPVKNRGINADTTAGVLKRLDQIAKSCPAAVFILIGTNDLPWYAYRSNEDILMTYEQILQRLKTETPATQVFVQSILPRARFYSGRIRRLNAGLEALAERCGCTYINLFPHFVGPDGQLHPELTNDQLHLLGAGYQRWAHLLKPYLERLSGS